jgi:hypothetical protein
MYNLFPVDIDMGREHGCAAPISTLNTKPSEAGGGPLNNFLVQDYLNFSLGETVTIK